jgi:lipopolysaccharide/colanic/teichoic acid biosynthesis glycosyltransferase
MQEVTSVPLFMSDRARIAGAAAFVKAILDYVGAAALLVVLSPLLLLAAVMVKAESPGPVIHRREVLGRGGVTFDAFKIRTMVANADEILASDRQLSDAFEKSYKLRDDPRITRVGRLLRRTSIDEVPQLVNVLRGEMSLVGPRMIAPEEASRYGEWRSVLLTVKPGITGPWQVDGRGDIPYDERVRLSVQYIREYSIWLDLRIMLRTLFVVVRGRGAY